MDGYRDESTNCCIVMGADAVAHILCDTRSPGAPPVNLESNFCFRSVPVMLRDPSLGSILSAVDTHKVWRSD